MSKLTLELKKSAINKLNSVIEKRKKLLKIDILYFNQPIDGISHFSILPCNNIGQFLYFSNIKAYTVLKMIKEVQEGNIYGWIEYNGSRCKIRPKKIEK